MRGASAKHRESLPGRLLHSGQDSGRCTVALVSPLHPLGEVLFSAHMIQHEILMLVAAPLLVLSRPLVPMLWGLPFEGRRTAGRWSKQSIVQSVWRALTVPAVAWFVHGAALWAWHAPRAFEATLSSDWIHAAQHVSFFGSALLFWWSLFYSRPTHSYGAAVLYLFSTAMHTSALGALLTFGAYGLVSRLHADRATVGNLSS